MTTRAILTGCIIAGILISGCKTLIPVPQNLNTIHTTEVQEDIVDKIGLVMDSSQSSNPTAMVCGSIPLPKYLKDLNQNDIYTSNISLAMNTSLQAYGFSGSMGKKDILIVAYLTKFKDYNCGGAQKRASVGVKLFVHASELKIKANSPTLPMIAAAVELGLAKAEYRFRTFGINPDDFYSNLPSAYFTVDTYSKVISAYDNIVHSLKDSTEIDPIISDPPTAK